MIGVVPCTNAGPCKTPSLKVANIFCNCHVVKTAIPFNFPWLKCPYNSFTDQLRKLCFPDSYSCLFSQVPVKKNLQGP